MKVMILKIGGKLLDDPALLIQQLQAFAQVTDPKILVHGGGVIADEWLHRMDIPVRMREGRRITCEKSLQILTMVYSGLSKTLVAALKAYGLESVGLSGCDAGLIISQKRASEPEDYGLAGDPESLNTGFLEELLCKGIVPVVNSITCDKNGQLLNTNADTISSFIAARLSQAGHEVTLALSFELDQVRHSFSDPATGLTELDYETCRYLKQKGQLKKGILPKITAGFSALHHGVSGVFVGRFQQGFQNTCTRLIANH